MLGRCMKKTFSAILLVTLLLIFPIVGCSRTTQLSWQESDGRFYTNDLTRAQEEIPFPILLPTYVPGAQKGSTAPQVTGPLKAYQYDNKVKINVLYLVTQGDDVVGTIEINESNYAVTPGDPKTNPGLTSIEINGKAVIREGSPPQSIYFYFNQDNIYVVAMIRDFNLDEATRVMQSMIR